MYVADSDAVDLDDLQIGFSMQNKLIIRTRTPVHRYMAPPLAQPLFARDFVRILKFESENVVAQHHRFYQRFQVRL
jgi:hypothetical protein